MREKAFRHAAPPMRFGAWICRRMRSFHGAPVRVPPAESPKNAKCIRHAVRLLKPDCHRDAAQGRFFCSGGEILTEGEIGQFLP